MKQFFESYGAVALGILALLVLIVMITPVGNIIKTSLQGTAHKFSSSINSQTDTMTSDMEKMLENSMYVSEYAKEVLSKQRLYDVGEQNLTADDIVTINGVDCYVLEATASTAKLITKDIYNVRFDTGGHTAEEVNGRIGKCYSDSTNTTCTYDYRYSTLRSWMNDFYTNNLGSNSRILPVNINYYIQDDSGISENLSTFSIYTLSGEYVFPLDAFEASEKANEGKFNWSPIVPNNYTKNFWTTGGSMYIAGSGVVWTVQNDGVFNRSSVYYGGAGARPVFWITLE